MLVRVHDVGGGLVNNEPASRGVSYPKGSVGGWGGTVVVRVRVPDVTA